MKKITTLKRLFKKVDGEIEVTRVLETKDHKNCIVYYLMPYSNIENEFTFDIELNRQEAINEFCLEVRKKENEMIDMIKDCANNVEDYFNEGKEN